ncbi:MAG TPA: hypothetical protein VF800_16400 [Telluria sp.]|jgi:hypothetical protein
MRLRSIIATCAALLLTACASSPPTFQAMAPSNAGVSGYTLGRSPLLDHNDHTIRHLDKENTVLYKQTSGGGGVGLGLLLGPIGIAANVSMIESRTKEDVALLQGKLNLDPRGWFSEAVGKNGITLGDGAAATRATPYFLIAKMEDERLVVSSAVIVEQQHGAAYWRGTYTYQIPQTYTVAELANLDAAGLRTLHASGALGFDALIKHIAQEKPEGFDKEPRILFRSRMLFVVDADMPGALVADEGDVVWVRSFTGVHGLRKANMKYTLKK